MTLAVGSLICSLFAALEMVIVYYCTNSM